MGDTATGSWGSRELGGFMRREQARADERDRREEWASIKAAVAEEARMGYGPAMLAVILRLDEEVVRRALREIESESKTVLP